MTRQDIAYLRPIAEERIEILLRLAREMVKKEPALSRRYVELARQIAMRTGVRLGAERKQFICKRCGSSLVPGLNCRVRIRCDGETRVIMTCLGCGSRKRYPAVNEKRASRRRKGQGA